MVQASSPRSTASTASPTDISSRRRTVLGSGPPPCLLGQEPPFGDVTASVPAPPSRSQLLKRASPSCPFFYLPSPTSHTLITGFTGRIPSPYLLLVLVGNGALPCCAQHDVSQILSGFSTQPDQQQQQQQQDTKDAHLISRFIHLHVGTITATVTNSFDSKKGWFRLDKDISQRFH